MTAGVEFAAGMAFDPATGRVAASFDGAAAVAVTGGPEASTLTAFRLANNAPGANATPCEVSALRVLPYVLTDTDLAAAVAAL
jgi:hypothetical protein